MTESRNSTLPDPQEPEGLTFIQDRAEIFKMLVQSSNTQCEATLSFRGDARKFIGQMIELDRYSDLPKVELANDEQKAAFEKARIAAEASGRSECLILIHSKRQYLLGLHCKVKGFKGSEVTFEFPGRVFKLQRRRALRWVLTGAYEVELEMGYPDQASPGGLRRLSHRLTDVSPGGVSFYLQTEKETGRGPSDWEVLCHPVNAAKLK